MTNPHLDRFTPCEVMGFIDDVLPDTTIPAGVVWSVEQFYPAVAVELRLNPQTWWMDVKVSGRTGICSLDFDQPVITDETADLFSETLLYAIDLRRRLRERIPPIVEEENMIDFGIHQTRVNLIEDGTVEGKRDWYCKCIDCKPSHLPKKFKGTKTAARAAGWQISNTSADRVFSPQCARNIPR